MIQRMPAHSRVTLELRGAEDPDRQATYKAIVVALPAPLDVQITGEENGVALIRHELGKAGPNGKPSLFVRESADSPELRILAQERGFRIMRAADIGHAKLRANARLSTMPAASRDADMPALPPILRDNPSVSQPFQFSAGRNGEPGLSVLELTDVEELSAASVELVVEFARNVRPLRSDPDLRLREYQNAD